MEELTMRLTRLALVVVLLLLPPAARAEVVVQAYELPKGGGPHDVAVGADGVVWYTAQRAGQLGRLDPATGKVELIPLGAGAAPHGVIVGPDGKGRIGVSEWNAGNVSRYDPATSAWKTWRLPGAAPRAYAVYVDDKDMVWLSDWGANAMVRFDPETEKFQAFPSERGGANVRQILGRPGEVWAPESGADRLVVYRTK